MVADWMEELFELNKNRYPLVEKVCAPHSMFTSTHFHVKTGIRYRELMRGRFESNLEDAVVYDDEHGNIWIRSAKEFDQEERFIDVR